MLQSSTASRHAAALGEGTAPRSTGVAAEFRWEVALAILATVTAAALDAHGRASRARPIWTNSAVGVFPWAFALVGWAAAELHARHPIASRAWAFAAVLWAVALRAPAVGISAAPTDRLVRALVAPVAFEPFVP